MLLAQPKNTNTPIKQQHRWSKDWSVFKQTSYANNYLTGKPLTIDSTRIAVEMQSNAAPFPTYQQQIAVSAHPVDVNGNSLSSAVPLNYSFNYRHSAFTGANNPSVVVFDTNQYSRWTVSTPKTASSHNNVSHEWFNVYVPK